MKKMMKGFLSAFLAVVLFAVQFSLVANAENVGSASQPEVEFVDQYIFLHMFEPTFAEVSQQIGSNITVYKVDGTVVSSGFIGTGMKAELSDKSVKTLIVDYDLSGDGGVDAVDVIRLRKCILGVETPDISVIYAANCGVSNNLSVLNLIRIKKYLVNNGTYSVVPYSTGLNDDLQYNSTLYGMNGSNDVEGADPGCFYVSEEEDADYGGYYYMYKSGSTFDTGTVIQKQHQTEQGLLGLAYICYRSKDMYNWQPFGSYVAGYSLRVQASDWCRKNFWAPEVIRNPKDGKYYMYFSASSDQNWGVASMSSSSNELDRLYLGVAVSDTPCGPFNIIYDIDPSTGKRIPTVNFHTGCNTQYDWPAIDASPFFDDNGDLYLYFNKSDDNRYHSIIGVWGMKMVSMSKPDYSTVSFLATPGKTTASNTPGNIESGMKGNTAYGFDEGSINEAPFMIKHNGKYYLTYASNGCGAVDYSVHQAISNSPLSGFVKLSAQKGNPVLNGNDLGYMNGTAHHAFVKCGNELWIVYHRHNSLKGMEAGWDRSICADRVHFVKNSDNADVLVANGPTRGLNWLPESVSGYRNLAKDANITVNNGTGATYLSDEILPYYTLTKNKAFKVSSGDVTIHLNFEDPVNASSVMIYNAFSKNKAFSKVSSIIFTSSDGSKHIIKDLAFPNRYYENGMGKFIGCAPAVADFGEIETTEISITVSAKDRLNTTTENLELSEIVVLGKSDADASEDFSCNSFCKTESDADVIIDGKIDERCWMDNGWTKTGFDDNEKVYMQARGFVTEKGLYLAAKSVDGNIVNDGDLTMESNTLFGFSLIPENESNNLYSTSAIIDMRGDCYSATAIGFKRVVKVDGSLNSGNTSGAVMEAFFPWEALKIKPTDNKPASFTVNITYYAYFKGEKYNKTTKTVSFVVGAFESNFVDGSSLFVKSVVTPSGKTVYSATGNWDTSNIAENKLVGSYSMGSVLKPMYFSSQSNTWLISADVSYSTPSQTISAGGCQPDLLAGIILNSGSSNGWVGVRQHGIVYNEKWIEHVIPYDVLTTWDSSHRNINLQILLDDGYLYFVVDGKYAGKLAASDVVPDFNVNIPIAVGLTMGADKKSEITYKNIGFSEDYGKIAAFIENKNIDAPIPGKILFASSVEVNGESLYSAMDKWDITDIDRNVVRASSDLGSKQQPLYFAETGKNMYLSMHIKSSGDSVDYPTAGVWFSNGTSRAWVGLYDNKLMFSPGNDTYVAYINKNFNPAPISPNNGGSTEADLEFLLINGVLTITVNKTQSQTISLLDNLFISVDKDFAFGLVARNDSTKKFDFTFSNIKFSVDDVFKYDKDNGIGNLFARRAYVNSKVVQSAVSNWDLTNVDNNVVKASSDFDSKHQPLYFAETGKTMHLSTHVTVSSDSHSTVGAGLWLDNGEKSLYICTHTDKVIYKQVNSGGAVYATQKWSSELLSPEDGGATEVDLDFALENDILTITANGSQSISMKLYDMDRLPLDNEWAFGLVARADGVNGVPYHFDVTFSNISFEVQQQEKSYKVSYYANGSLIEKVPFVLSNPTVSGKEPTVPAIPNTVGTWEPHSISGLTGGMTVNAVYRVTVPTASTAIALNQYAGSKININTDVISEYLATDTSAQTAYVREFCSHSPRTYQDHQNTSFKWTDSGSNGSYTVYFADNADFDNAYIVRTNQTSLVDKVGIFVPGKTYYWFVYGNDSGKASAVDSFTVEDTRVRYITAGTVINMRDLGGLTTTDGYKVKYSLVYRGAALDETNSHIDDTSRGVFDYLNINSEIELRGANKHSYTGWDENDPDVYFIGAVDYEPLFTINNSTKAAYKAAFEGLADESNYPFYFHCSVGADRTGTFAYLLYGLLGVSYEDIRADYELTSFSKVGLRPADVYADYGSLDSMHRMMLQNYGGGSADLKTAVENFLMNYIGVQKNTIDSIRNLMLEKTI